MSISRIKIPEMPFHFRTSSGVESIDHRYLPDISCDSEERGTVNVLLASKRTAREGDLTRAPK